MIDRIKRIAELVVLLDKLLPVIGLGSLVAIAYGSWASLSAMRPEYLIPLVLAVMAATVLLINGIRAFLRYRQEGIMNQSLKLWSLSERFNLLDAAQILVRAHNPVLLTACYRTLKDWGNSGRLKFESPDEKGNAWKGSSITKVELLRIAPDFGRNDPFN